MVVNLSIGLRFLDCGSAPLSDRGISQEMLSWAAWHRMHAVYPQWRQDVIRENVEPGMQWDRYEKIYNPPG